MLDIKSMQWLNEPESYSLDWNKVEIITAPHTDLWQRTYYHFRNDNAPMLQFDTDERYFSFSVRTQFAPAQRFDQCGIILYLDSENWLKASVEYEDDKKARLGSVVTNNGFSDWATTDIGAGTREMWYRLSRREDDFLIECSDDGINYRQMRICHLFGGAGKIRLGVYACSPENSSFLATFTDFELTDCKWLPHDGQQPD